MVISSKEFFYILKLRNEFFDIYDMKASYLIETLLFDTAIVVTRRVGLHGHGGEEVL